MALAEFKNPNIQLLVKDDAGTPHRRAGRGAAGARRRRRDHLGPLFAQSVSAVGASGARAQHPDDRVLDRRQRRRARRLSAELPAGDRCRAHRRLRGRRSGKRSFAALAAGQRLWHGGGGRVPAGGRAPGGRIVALERYPARSAADAEPVRRVAQAPASADAIFIPDGADVVPPVVQTACAPRLSTSSACSCSAPGLWDDPRIFPTERLQGGWYRGAGRRRLPGFRDPLSRALRPGSGAHRDAVL